MKKIIYLFHITVVGGILFLVPFLIIFIILEKAFHIAREIVTPIAEYIPVDTFFGLELPMILAIGILFLVCLLAGLFAKTRIAQKIVHWLDTTILSNLPGYSLMKLFLEELAGVDPVADYQSVLVQFDDAWQLGYQLEYIEKDKIVVFIPDSPSPLAGGVFIVPKERVTFLDDSSMAVANCMKNMGKGTGLLVKNKL